MIPISASSIPLLKANISTWSKTPSASLVMLPLLPIEFGTPYIRRIASGNLKPLGHRANLQSPPQTRCYLDTGLRRKKHVLRRGFSIGSFQACMHRYRHIYAWSTLTRQREPGHVNPFIVGSTRPDVICFS